MSYPYFKALIIKRLLLFVFVFAHFFAFSQVSVFTEGFENGSNMPTGWTQQYVYDTLNWVFMTGSHTGHPSAAHGGTYNAMLYYGGVYKTTKLISPSLNLSPYSNLQLTFWHTQEAYSSDQDILRVYYKTSSTGSWSLLASYTSNVSSWTKRTISLTGASSTYYIAFEGEARYGYGICVDDVEITGTVAYGTDISCTGISSPTIFGVGNNTLSINYKNMRSDTIFNADFGYKLNSNSPVIDTNKTTNILLANQTKTYTFSSPVNLSKGNHYLKVWANKPNRKNPDDVPTNDTFTLNFGTGIKDTFIIDRKGGGDYTSFSAAVADLNNGVTGPVWFFVKPGTYTERVVIGDIPGASSTNTITFDGIYPDSVILTYAGVSQSSRATLVFKGGDYISFKNLTIRNTDNTNAVCLFMTNKTEYNKFKNVKFKLNTTNSSGWQQVILVSSAENSQGSNGDNANYCTFEDCLIEGGYYGVRWHGTNTTTPSMNNVFINCTFQSILYYGIYNYYLQGFELRNCTLKNFRNTGAYGMLNYYSMASTIDGNIIQPGSIGIYFYLENYYNQTKSSLIANNMISNFSNTSNQTGIYLYYYCNNVNVYHNSLWLDGTSTTPTQSAISLYYFCNNSNIKNNILVSTGGSFLVSSLYANTVSFDYNDYYHGTSSTDKFYVNYVTGTFTTFKSSSTYINYPHDVNSFYNIDPKYVSKTNLHLDTFSTPSLLAPSVGISKDIDGTTRSTMVNVGADEIRHPSRDLDFVSIDSPTVVSMGLNTVSVTLRNSGTDSIPAQMIYLSYKVDAGGWTYDSFYLTPKLPPYQTASFTFKTKWNVTSTTSHTLCVRIFPRIINDPDTLDQICASKCVGRSGNYVIDPTGKGDFTTITAAVSSLTGCGIAGPVKFTIKAGTYAERVVIPYITGTSSVNTITFEGVHRDSVTLIFAGTTTDRTVVLLNGAKYMVFKNMKIYNNGNSYATAVHLMNNASYNTFDNCYLKVNSAASSYINCVLASNSEQSYNGYGNNANYNVFKGNIVEGGYFSFGLTGSSQTALCYGNKIIGNTITNSYYYGIYAYTQGDLEIKENKIINVQLSYAYGIMLYYNSGSRVESNVIQPGRIGIYTYYENYYVPGKKSYILNNMISNFSDGTYQSGILIYYYSNNFIIEHNSIWLDGTIAYTTYACISLYYYSDSAIVKNNALASTSNAYLISFYYSRGTKVDYNDYYYSTGSSAKFYNRAAYSDYATYKASNYDIVYPHDVNSYDNIDPGFTSISDLHLKPTVAGLGGDSLGITKDIDGDNRCMPYPTLGADEAGPLSLFTVNQQSQCFSGHNFIFTNTSQGGSTTLSYYWTFGDGDTSTLKNPSHIYDSAGIYQVKLVVFPAKGCNDTTIMNITVLPSPTADFSINDPDQCQADNSFIFTNKSTIKSGTMTYNWNFGDGYFATLASPTHSYSYADTFDVILIAKESQGCADTTQKQVIVFPQPDADFSINSTNQCSTGNNFVFTNTSTLSSGTMSYLWNFGDGNTSTLKDPNHSYSSLNMYYVKLLATSNIGCKDSILRTVNVIAAPTAAFTINDTSQCLNLNSFSFTNSSTVSGSLTLNYLWDFGDSSVSTLKDPVHVFTKSGSYAVKLVASTGNGCKDSLIKTVVVHPSLIASFTVSDSNLCFIGNAFTFTNKTTTTTGTMSYLWDFNDGNTALAKDTTYSFTYFGTFHVKLTASSTNGCADSFTKTLVVNPMPLSNKDTSLSNSLATQQLAYYPFSGNSYDISGMTNDATVYGATLTTDRCDKSSNAYSFNGSSNYLQAPHAFLLNPLSDDISMAAWIYPTKSNAEQYIIAKYQSTLYKGYYLKIQNNKIYAFFGGQLSPVVSTKTINLNQWNHVAVIFDGENYTFYLNGEKAGNGTSAFSFSNTSVLYMGRNSSGYYFQGKIDEVRIYGKTLNNREIYALYSEMPSVEVSDNMVCYNGNAFVNIYNSARGIEYSLYDTISKSQIGSKTYGNGCKISINTGNISSSKVLRIIAKDTSIGCQTIFDTILHIQMAPVPASSFSITENNQCLKGNSFSFTNTSTLSSGTMTYQWSFGDGQSSTLKNPTHSYTYEDSFTVTLITKSDLGCPDTFSKGLVIYPTPNVIFYTPDSLQCFDNNNFGFINASGIDYGTISYLWNFGDGSTSTLKNPTHSYLTPDTFMVKLIVTSDKGCKDSLIKPVYIHPYPAPKAKYTINDSTQCKQGNLFSFTNQSTISSGTFTSLWRFGDGTQTNTNNPTHIYSADNTYTVTLVVESLSGCKDSLMKNVYVYPNPKTLFSINDSTQCFDGNQFSFTNTSTIKSGSISPFWTFGDGYTSGSNNPSHAYNTANTFNVKLVNTSNLGCTDSLIKTVIIYPSPDADFSINDSTQCLQGNSFTFSDKTIISGGTLTYKWLFGDGGSSTSKNPVYSYAAAGTYKVKLVVNSNNSCPDSIIKTVYVYPNPKSSFTVNDSDQCLNGNSVNFTNTSTIPSGTLSYLWRFGDGSTSTSGNPSHTYSSSGTYIARLISTSDKGCPDSVSKNIYIYPKPQVSFNINGTDQCLSNNSYSFTNTSSISAGTLTYLWSFGDGYTSTASSPVHQYANPGTYTVKLRAMSDKGCADSTTRNINVWVQPVASFTVNDTALCLNGNSFTFTNKSTISSGTISYLWSMGDSKTYTSQHPVHSYTSAGTYTVKLIITSDKGCKDSFSRKIYVYPNPKAGFTVNDTDQCLSGNNYTFTNTTTISSGTLTYFWTFGDGGTSTQSNPAHTYSSYGTFNLKMLATSNLGCKDSVGKAVVVHPMPKAGFTINDSTQCMSGNNYTFTNTSTIASGSMTYKWTFGDGNSSTSQHPAHTYTTSGTYKVKLVTTSSFGCKDSITKTVYIYPQPVSAFSINNSAQCLRGNNFSFTNQSTIASGSMAYKWTFGDGNSSTSQHPTHTYITAGTYQVKLMVTSNYGCPDSVTKSVIIHPMPAATFSVNDTDQCLNSNNFIFSNSSTISSGTLSYYWSFGDGNFHTDKNPQHIYSSAGTFNVKLRATSSQGCSDSITKKVYVNPNPVTKFNINDSVQCFSGNAFILSNTSTISSGSMSYLWKFGDGKTSTKTSDTHSYATPGTYSIKLIVNSNLGCSDSIQKTVVVDPSPVSKFSVNNNTQCFKGNNFIFSNNTSISGGTVSHYWTFGDNSSSTAKDPSHSYTFSDTFTVKMVSTSDKGCSDSASAVVYVFPNPVAKFSINDSVQCFSGNAFILSNSSTLGSGSMAYLWKFGDGNSSTQTSDTHSYATSGTYSIKLIVNSNLGCSDSIQKTVVVDPSPVSKFSVNDNTQCFNGNNFIFSNNTSISGGSVGHYWTFGDNTSSTSKNPSHSYNYPDTFTVKLFGISDKGCTDSATTDVYVFPTTIASFTVNNSIQCFGSNLFEFTNTSSVAGTVNYLWDFGDGITSSLKDPNHTYTAFDTFKVSLFVTTPNGCNDTFSAIVIVSPGAKAGFTVNDTALCFKGNNFSFTNTTLSNTTNTKYYWNFGDGNSSTAEHPSHIYMTLGDYIIKLVSVPDSGCMDSFSMMVHVYPMPAASFSINDSIQCLNTNTFILSNQSTISKGKLEYYWTFGDSGSDTSKNIQYIYTSDGNYTISLVVKSAFGCVDSMLKNVIVHPNPLADFETNDSAQCFGTQNFLFTNQSSGTGIISYKWHFGDGDSSNAFSPSHQYTKDGNYLVTLTVGNDKNCSDVLSKSIFVSPKPVVDFILNKDQQCDKDNLAILTNKTSFTAGKVDYLWYFGDGDTSSQFSPQHHYLSTGTYIIKLVASTEIGCSDSISRTISINPSPTAAFLINKNPQCFKNNLFAFINMSSIKSGKMNYLWDFGDAYTSKDSNSSHIYLSYGTYTAKLIITSDKGCLDSIEKTTTIHPMPKASFTVNKNPQCFFDNLFEFSNKSDLASGVMTYHWGFGDGETSTSNEPKHHFNINDTFKVMLVAKSDAGCNDTTYGQIHTLSGPPVSLGADIYTQLNVMFNIDAGYGYSSYLWSDNTTSRYYSVNTNNLGLGTHAVWVIVSDGGGCKNADTVLIHVRKDSGIPVSGNGHAYWIYPNPTNGLLHIKFEKLLYDEAEIWLTDINGKVLSKVTHLPEMNKETVTIDMTDIPKGIYFIRVVVGDDIFVDKVMRY